MTSTYRAVEISSPGVFSLVERKVAVPGAGQVRIRVEACGVCHSDVATVEAQFPNLSYPRVPGHEVIGRIEEVGPGVTTWKTGQRVGVGFFGGEDGTCEPCRRGETVYCQNPIITGVTTIGSLLPGLKVRGKLVTVGVSGDAIPINGVPLIFGGRSVVGSLTGRAIETQDTLDFSVLTDVRPMIETLPLEKAEEAYRRMMSGEARFRMVLTMA